MARKPSDLVLLLGSRGGGGRGRGRSRSSGGVLGQVVGSFRWLLGGSPRARKSGGWKSFGSSFGGSVPTWLVLGLAFACFAGGYFVGGRFGGPGRGNGDSGLRADLGKGPQTPGIIEDTKPLSNNAFYVAFYENLTDEAARERASLLAAWLRQQGLETARPYQTQTKLGLTWFVLVYYSGDANQNRIREQLKALPDVTPDPAFDTCRIQDSDWPMSAPVR